MSLIGNIVGIRMNVLIGNPLPLPMPVEALSGIHEVEIKLSDCEPSGFKMTVQAGRTGPIDFLGPTVLTDPRFGHGSRVIVTMIFDVKPTVIFDGKISKSVYRPGSQPGQGTLTLLGRDLSVELDREVKQAEHPAQDETVIAAKIAASYPQFGLLPETIPPKVIDAPIPIDRTPQQNCSDWAYLNHMARRHGYETYIDPGPAPGLNKLYWGPPIKPGIPQKAITVNMGAGSDAYDVEVWQNLDELTTVEGFVEDRLSGQKIPVYAAIPSQSSLGLVPAGVLEFGRTRSKKLSYSGLSGAQAMARAQAEVDCAARKAYRVTGTLDSANYNGALKARDLVDLRGVGAQYGGTYKVAEVRHLIRPGSYLQEFELTRSELGPKLPVVMAG